LERSSAMRHAPTRQPASPTEPGARNRPGALRSLTLLLCAAGAGLDAAAAPGGEPGEADMLAAYERRLQGVNDYARSTTEQCQRGEYKRGQGDPALAMQCLAFVTMRAGRGGAPAMKATQFRKIACEKAQGEPGYWCDYTAGIDMNMPLP